MSNQDEAFEQLAEEATQATESTDTATEQPAAEAPKFMYTSANVTMGKAPFKMEIPKKYANVLPLAAFGLSFINLQKLESPNVNLLKNANDKWAAAYGQAYEDNIAATTLTTQPIIDLEKAAADGGDWRQDVTYNGYVMRMDIPRIEPRTTGEKLTGTAASNHISMLIGGGKYIRIPLFASGFWITLSTPTNNELLNLNIKLLEKKDQVGRDTAGAIFSNRQALVTEDIYEFIQKHIYECSIRNWADTDLATHIKTTDWYALVHAMSCAVFPEGYKYAIPCVYKPTDCNYVEELILNLGKMIWTDGNKVSTAQRKFMYEALSKPSTIKEIESYQTDMATANDNIVEINDNVKIALRVSSVRDLITSGNNWIRDVTTILDKLAFRDTSDEQRQYLLRSHMVINSIREYSHYVERFITTVDTADGEKNFYIEEVADIESNIEKIAADNELVEIFTAGIGKFIERNIVTLVATPNFVCPQCQKPQQSDEATNHPLLVSFDALMVFTTLMARRLSLIGN